MGIFLVHEYLDVSLNSNEINLYVVRCFHMKFVCSVLDVLVCSYECVVNR